MKKSSLLLDVDTSALASVPHIDQWCGPWAIVPTHLQIMAESIRKMDLRSHLQEVRANGLAPVASFGGGDAYGAYGRITDGIVVIGCCGPMMKHRASMTDNVSTVMMRRTLRAAANDSTVRGIMMVFDSPGGTVSGTQDLAADIAEAATKKTVHGYAEDLAASAAYWCVSQTQHIAAGPTALVGSIGTFAVVEDYSQQAADIGVKVHVVKAGQFKGTGVPGTEVTDDQLANIQRVIDGLNEHFLAGVEKGRALSRSAVKELNDGRLHLAEAAQDLKLIDAVESFAEAFERLDESTNSKRSIRMSTESPAPAASTDAPNQEAKEKPTTTQPKVETLDQRAELKRYMGAFGDTAGAKYFAEGLDYTDACESHIIALDEQLTAAVKRADDAEAKLASLSLGEDSAIDTGKPASAKKRTFAEHTSGKSKS